MIVLMFFLVLVIAVYTVVILSFWFYNGYILEKQGQITLVVFTISFNIELANS
jgi:hypothetical protein